MSQGPPGWAASLHGWAACSQNSMPRATRPGRQSRCAACGCRVHAITAASKPKKPASCCCLPVLPLSRCLRTSTLAFTTPPVSTTGCLTTPPPWARPARAAPSATPPPPLGASSQGMALPGIISFATPFLCLAAAASSDAHCSRASRFAATYLLQPSALAPSRSFSLTPVSMLVDTARQVRPPAGSAQTVALAHTDSAALALTL